MTAQWFHTAAQDGIHGGVAECTIHAPHPTKPDKAYTLAEVYGFSAQDAEQKAKLIAAAPDLLAALQGVLRELGLEWRGNIPFEEMDTVERAHAVIKKATQP